MWILFYGYYISSSLLGSLVWFDLGPVVRCNIAWVIEYTVPQTQAILRNEPRGDCLLIRRGHPWIHIL